MGRWNNENSASFHSKLTKPSVLRNEPEFKLKSKKDYTEEFLIDFEEKRDRHAGQIQILDSVFEDNATYVFVRAGRKFTKTTTLIDIGWKIANIRPKSITYLCYPTIAQGIEVVWEEKRLQKFDLKDDYMFDKYVAKTDDNKHIVWFNNESLIKLVGTWTEARGRGTQPDCMLFDEVQDCNPDYIEAMDSNLAPKNAPCIMAGTPPKKRNHYQDWWERIKANPKGKTFHFTSYSNDRIPHLSEWLDNKKTELIQANKEDVWMREYLAEDCFSSADRVLPDAKIETHSQILSLASNFDYNQRSPFMAISIAPTYFCSILGLFVPKKTAFLLDISIHNQTWQKSFTKMFEEMGPQIKELQDFCGKKIVKVIWDESESFNQIIDGFSNCRKDIKWQDRGIMLLRELMLTQRIFISEKVSDFGMECQKLLMDESMKEIQKNYPIICTLCMAMNEFFYVEKPSIANLKEFDKYQGLREMGIPCPPIKKKGRQIFNYGL